MLELLPDLLETLLEILLETTESVAGIRKRRFLRHWRALSRGKRIGAVFALLACPTLLLSAALARALPLRIGLGCAGLAAFLWAFIALFPIQPSRYTRENQ